MADYNLQYQDTYIDALLATVNELKSNGYIFKGVATPSTNPGTTTEKCAYIASEAGTYTNFGSLAVTGLSVLTYNGTAWSATSMELGFDNAESGLAATNIHDAIGEIVNDTPIEVFGYWQQGTIRSDGTLNENTTGRIVSGFVKIKYGSIIRLEHNGQRASINVYDANKGYIGNFAAFTDLHDLDFKYENNNYQYGYFYVRFVVAKASDINITPQERAAQFYIFPPSEYLVNNLEIAKEIDIANLPVGIGYPSATTQKWLVDMISGQYRYHRIIRRTSGMTKIRFKALSTSATRYAFVTAYSVPTATTPCNFCSGHVAVYNLEQGKTSDWVDIPSDCNYIILIEQNGATRYYADAVWVDNNITHDCVDFLTLTSSDFTQGGLTIAYGTDTQSTGRIRSRFITVNKDDLIKIEYHEQHVSIYQYDTFGKFLQATGWYYENYFKIPYDGYVRIVIGSKSTTDVVTPSGLVAAISLLKNDDNARKIDNANWRSKNGLVVATWNIGHFSFGNNTDSSVTAATYDDNKAEYSRLIKWMDADILALTEYSAIFYQSETARDLFFQDMSWGHVGTQNSYACQATYLDRKVNSVSDINITSVTTTHYYTLVTFEHLGKTIKLVNIHFQANSSQPDDTGIIAQYNEIVSAFASDDYVIIAGDFNLLQMSSLSVFTNAGYTLANGGEWGNIETYTHQKGTLTNYCFDNIAVKGFYMTDVIVFTYDLSDHYPLVCKLMLKQN